MSPLEMVKLTALMQRTRGRDEIVIGLIDGPVAIKHLDLARSTIREISGNLRPIRTKRLPSASYLSWLYLAGASHFCRDNPWERTDAKRNA